MALTNEDLLAMSQLLDVKLDARLKPMENDIKSIKDEQTRINLIIENDIQLILSQSTGLKSTD